MLLIYSEVSSYISLPLDEGGFIRPTQNFTFEPENQDFMTSTQKIVMGAANDRFYLLNSLNDTTTSLWHSSIFNIATFDHIESHDPKNKSANITSDLADANAFIKSSSLLSLNNCRNINYGEECINQIGNGINVPSIISTMKVVSITTAQSLLPLVYDMTPVFKVMTPSKKLMGLYYK